MNRALKWSILGPQNLGLGGGCLGPPLDPHLVTAMKVFFDLLFVVISNPA